MLALLTASLLAASILSYRSSGVLWWESARARGSFCATMLVDVDNDVLGTFATACPACDFGAAALRVGRWDELCLRERFARRALDVEVNGTLLWSARYNAGCLPCVSTVFE